MFQFLSSYNRILVTGPQRSGTTICAYMIAQDLGYVFYPEERIGIANLDKLLRLFAQNDRFVVQCPALCRYAHMVSAEDVAIVLMRRNVDDIVRSENRIGWGGHRRGELARYDLTSGVISQVKYEYWAREQRALIHHPFEIEYESLSAHPLWVPRERRVNFGKRQIDEHNLTVLSLAPERQGAAEPHKAICQ